MRDPYWLRLSRNCYYVCLGLCAACGVGWLLLSVFHISLTEINPWPCTLYSTVGLYCPGCGGTRAVSWLLRGDLIRSFLYHPLVPYTAILVVCYTLSHTLHILSKGRLRAMLFSPVYFYVMIGIVLINWIVKNAFILAKGIYLIG